MPSRLPSLTAFSIRPLVTLEKTMPLGLAVVRTRRSATCAALLTGPPVRMAPRTVRSETSVPCPPRMARPTSALRTSRIVRLKPAPRRLTPGGSASPPRTCPPARRSCRQAAPWKAPQPGSWSGSACRRPALLRSATAARQRQHAHQHRKRPEIPNAPAGGFARWGGHHHRSLSHHNANGHEVAERLDLNQTRTGFAIRDR